MVNWSLKNYYRILMTTRLGKEGISSFRISYSVLKSGLHWSAQKMKAKLRRRSVKPTVCWPVTWERRPNQFRTCTKVLNCRWRNTSRRVHLALVACSNMRKHHSSRICHPICSFSSPDLVTSSRTNWVEPSSRRWNWLENVSLVQLWTSTITVRMRLKKLWMKVD